jgi:hypothetical protein
LDGGPKTGRNQERADENPHPLCERCAACSEPSCIVKQFAIAGVLDFKFLLTYAKALLRFGVPSKHITTKLYTMASALEFSDLVFVQSHGQLIVSRTADDDPDYKEFCITAERDFCLPGLMQLHQVYNCVVHGDHLREFGAIDESLYDLQKYDGKSRIDRNADIRIPTVSFIRWMWH